MLRRIFFLLILGIGTPLLRGQTVQIPPRVEARRGDLLLGDIAKILPPSKSLERVSLGYAPYPGQYRWLEKSDVEYYLRKAGIDQHQVTLQMKRRVLVTRDSRMVPETEIKQAIHEMFASRFPQWGVTLEQMTVPRDIVLPRGDLRIQVQPPQDLVSLDNLNLKLDFLINGKLEKSYWAKVNARAHAQVVAAAREIPFGRKIGPADIESRQQDLTRLEDYFSDPASLVGFVAKRTIQPGQIISRRDLRQATLVHRSDIVTVLARGSSFVVSAVGRARDSGAMGDTVEVENLDSKKVLSATVIGEKKVEVSLPEGLK